MFNNLPDVKTQPEYCLFLCHLADKIFNNVFPIGLNKLNINCTEKKCKIFRCSKWLVSVQSSLNSFLAEENKLMENEFNRIKLEALEMINDSNHNESIDYIYQGSLIINWNEYYVKFIL